MTPTAIIQPLSRLRQRERGLALAWGLARWFAVVALVLCVACYIDWRIDRHRDTPHLLRVGLSAVEATIALLAFVWWVAIPLLRRRPDHELALFVEDRRPELEHRLISAVQLNRRGAKTAGMSSALIDAVTREAEKKAGGIDFPALADHRRLRWSMAIAGVTLLVLGVAVIAAPRTVRALLARQLLAEVAIPRSVSVSDRTKPVQPAAEPVTITLAVEGRGPYTGELRIVIEGNAAQRVPIDVEPDNGVICVKLPPPSGDFHFEAWVGDGRLSNPGHVKLVARPAITALASTILLPSYVGAKADGSRFEQPQPRGELTGILGCSARVVAKMQKEVLRADIEILGSVDPLRAGPPPIARTVPMTLIEGNLAVAAFDLREGESAYRVLVWDEYEFRNLDPPRREVRLSSEEPPTVTLLPEQFRPPGATTGSAEEFEVEGVPVPLGAGIQIGYTASHPYGLGKAVLVYRLMRGPLRIPADGSAVDLSPRALDESWRRLALTDTPATEATGPFDLRRGCFLRSRPTDQVQFHAVPSNDQDRPNRLEGGGRFDFQTRGLPGLKVGDQIEYFIEVTNRNPDRPLTGQSETRSKRVTTVAELVEWIDGALRQEDRIRRLADRQRGVFDPRARQEKP